MDILSKIPQAVLSLTTKYQITNPKGLADAILQALSAQKNKYTEDILRTPSKIKYSMCNQDVHNKPSYNTIMPISRPKNDLETDVNANPQALINIFDTSRICCPEDVIAGSLITKEKRQELFGQVAGGSGSRRPEIFQRQKIVDGTGIACRETDMRINLRTNTLKEIAQPNTKNDGFDYSEDFDGVQCVKCKKVYINLKCIVGKGGGQTRSLREVYWFIEGQLNVLKSVENIYFANILDGDEAHSSMSKFEYVLSLPTFESVKERIYVGDLKGYFDWFKKTFGDE